MDRGPHVAVHARKKRSLRHPVRLSLQCTCLILKLLWDTDDWMSSRSTALDMLSILPGTLRNRSIFIHTFLPISSPTFMLLLKNSWRKECDWELLGIYKGEAL